MPTPVKVVFLFNDQSGTGWTETHYRLSSSATPDLAAQLANAVNFIAPARALMLGEQCRIVGVRVSYQGGGVINSLSTKMFLTGEAGYPDAAASLSLAVKFVDPGKSRKKICHVRGFWDVIESNGEYHPENDPAWAPRINGWKAALITNGYGWPAQDPAMTSRGSVTNYVSDASGRITFTLVPGAVALPAVGSIISIKFSRLNASNSPLNQAFVVEVLSPNTVKTVKPVAAGPFSGAGTYIWRGLAFLAYSEVYAISLGRRQQGRPIGQLPGRGPVRARF